MDEPVCQANTTMCYVKQDNSFTPLEAILGMTALVIAFCVLILIICVIQWCQRKSAANIFAVQDDQKVYNAVADDSVGAISSTDLTPIQHLKKKQKDEESVKDSVKTDTSKDGKNLEQNGSQDVLQPGLGGLGKGAAMMTYDQREPT